MVILGQFLAIFFGTILASLTLVTGLAWNSAIEKYIEKHPEFRDSDRWLYASLITVISVICTMIFSYVVSKASISKDGSVPFIPN
jgi:O-antigen/teichoic acid export membrane protein